MSIRWIFVVVPIVAAVAITLSLAQLVAPTKSNTLNPNPTRSNEPSSFNIASPYVREFLLPNGTWPNGILVDREGGVWTAGTKSSDLISLDAKNHEMKIYPIPHNASGANMVWAIVQATDGSIWLSGDSQNPLLRFDPSTEKFASIRSLGSVPFQMKVDGSNGNIWFTTLSPFAAGVIGVIQYANSGYHVKEFNLGNETFPSGLSLDGDFVWITEAAAQKIVKFKVITNPNGTVKDIEQVLAISPESPNLFFATPTDIVAFDNSSFWVTEHGTSFLTKYNLNSNNATRFPTSINPRQFGTLPYWVRASTSGNGLWFNEHTGNRIAFFNITDTTLTEYEIPTRDAAMGYIANALNLAVDPTDKNKAWFSELTEDKVGVVDNSLPIGFDIYSPQKRVVLDNTTANIDIEIIKKDNTISKTILLNASSSMLPSGALANVTANFSPDKIELAQFNGTAHLQLSLQRSGSTPPGSYTLGVSATDGAVTKSIYLAFIIRK